LSNKEAKAKTNNTLFIKKSDNIEETFCVILLNGYTNNKAGY